MFEADEVDHVEAVTNAAEAKLTALLQHRSQFRSTMGITSADAAAGTTMSPDADPETVEFRARVLRRLAEHGALAGVPLGEAFHRIRRALKVAWPLVAPG